MFAQAQMSRFVGSLRHVATEAAAATDAEDGHGIPLVGALVSGIGTIALGIGAANDTGWLAVAGGIVAFLGSVLMLVLNHMRVEYDIYRRLETLEGKK